ncbi:site-specific DNA-cytosine methylase [Lysinibacillus sp. TE18511]
MLSAFNNLGYSVEWRVINAAEHGGAQRRRRVFFFVYRNDKPFAMAMDGKYGVMKNNDILDWDDHAFDEYIFKDGLFARQFPIKQEMKYEEQHVIIQTDYPMIQ